MSWRDVLKALSKKGFKPVRQRGSHIIVENAEGSFAVVPRKPEIKPGTPAFHNRASWTDQRGIFGLALIYNHSVLISFMIWKCGSSVTTLNDLFITAVAAIIASAVGNLEYWHLN